MQFWKLNEENAWKDTIINDGKMSDVLRGSFLHPNGFRRHLQPTLFWAYTAIYQKKISHEKKFLFFFAQYYVCDSNGKDKIL